MQFKYNASGYNQPVQLVPHYPLKYAAAVITPCGAGFGIHDSPDVSIATRGRVAVSGAVSVPASLRFHQVPLHLR